LKANRGDAHDYTLEFGYYNVLQHSLRGCGKKFNASAQRRPCNGGAAAMKRASGGHRPRIDAPC